MIGSAMPELELVRLSSKCSSDQLESQAYPHHGFALYDPTNRRFQIAEMSRIARTGRKQDTVGLEGKNLVWRGGAGHGSHAAPHSAQDSEDVVLQAAVQTDYVGPTRLVPLR